jgi:hypothetical protein
MIEPQKGHLICDIDLFWGNQYITIKKGGALLVR